MISLADFVKRPLRRVARWRGNLEPTRRAGPLRGCEHDFCCPPTGISGVRQPGHVSAYREYELSVVSGWRSSDGDLRRCFQC